MTNPAQKKQRRRAGAPGDIPRAEWVVAGIGLAIVLAVLVFVLYEAVAGDSSPPDIAVSVESVRAVQDGYVLELRIRNRGGTTAAAVPIEGVLRDRSGSEERAEATIDYVPARSSVTAGLFFRNDPRAGELRVRALGYRRP
jgi:uncharacterized protein (TIGR02588 family)